MKNKLLDTIKTVIHEFENIDKIQIIGTFSSTIDNSSEVFDDLDLITICDKQTHDQFIEYLTAKLMNLYEKIIIFKDITTKPLKNNNKELLIHDLFYTSIQDLLSKQWKSVINSMKNHMIILHGDKYFPQRLPQYTVTKKELLEGILDWTKLIKKENEYLVFQKYIIKIIPKLLQEYSYLELDNLKQIKLVVLNNDHWKTQLEKIKNLL